MNCPVCGAMVPDGQAVCPACGAAMQQAYQQPQQQMYQQPQQQMYQQPQQQMYQQPQQVYQQPQQPMYQQPAYAPQGGGIGGYFSSFGSNWMLLVRFVGAVIMFISPFLPWVKVSLFGMSESGNMFKLIGAEKFFAIMMFLLAVIVVLWDMADYIPALGSIKAKATGVPFVELILVGVVFLIVLLACILATKDMYGLGKRTIGCWLALLSAIAIVVPSVMKLIQK